MPEARTDGAAPRPSPILRAAAPPAELLDILHPEPLARVEPGELSQALSFAYSSGVSGGLFGDALDRARVAPSSWEPAHFAQDLFLEDFVARCFRVRIGGREPLLHRKYLLRVLCHPPSDPRVADYRREVLRELGDSALFRQQFEQIYVTLCRFRAALEGATVGKKLDPNRRQLDILALAKELFDRMSEAFDGATSGLVRIREFGAAVRITEGYQSMASLLDYDEHLATLDLTIRVGADGRVRGFDVKQLRERSENPFVLSPFRRWLARFEMLWRGYRFGDGEVMARLLDAVFEGVEAEIAKLVPFVGDMEFYLGALGFRDMARAAGLEATLPDMVSSPDSAGPASQSHVAGSADGSGDSGPPSSGVQSRALLGLFNPLLVAHAGKAVPCDVVTDRADATVLITGPNSGGKTRLLQSIGLTQVLAQVGCFVPAKVARLIPAFGLTVSLIQETRADQSEGRLGMELLRIRALFEELGPGAMVILDELCSGTNPSEGEEIFELVVSLMSRLRPQAFITTHFLGFAGRLQRENAIANLRFLRVDLGPEQTPTYQFVSGVATTSLAANAAARLGVSRDELSALIERNTARARARTQASS